jgi:LmbE family N-acetylglucosaminyl deacetylase
VLQAHHDDFLFNGWKLITEGILGAQPVIACVFSQSSHLVVPDSGKSIEEISALRRREDEAVWSQFDGVVPLSLGFRDLPDRHKAGGIRSLEIEIEHEISRLIRELAISFLVVQRPSPVGGHADHQIVFVAARKVAERMGQIGILFTNDAPYSMIDPDRDELLNAGYEIATLRLGPGELRRKIRLIRKYRSQVRDRFIQFVKSNPWETLLFPRTVHDKLPGLREWMKRGNPPTGCTRQPNGCRVQCNSDVQGV